MSFIENNLALNEKIIYKTGLHWWIYVKRIILIFFGFVLLKASNSQGAASTIATLLILIGLIGLIQAFLLSRSSEFVVTNKRVILKTGMLKRKMTEIQLNRSEGLKVSEGIIGRMLGFGSIMVSSGGVTETFNTIPKPYEFKKHINNAIETSFPIANGQNL